MFDLFIGTCNKCIHKDVLNRVFNLSVPIVTYLYKVSLTSPLYGVCKVSAFYIKDALQRSWLATEDTTSIEVSDRSESGLKILSSLNVL